MTTTKPTLTLSDLLSQEASANADAPEPLSSPLGDREAIQQRTRHLRDKTATKTPRKVESQESSTSHEEPAQSDTANAGDAADLSQYVVGQTTGRAKARKPTVKSSDDKVTRSVQFSRATYRQMEKTLNYIAYKSGRRNVSFPKYFEKLHELARQQPDLMNQMIDHFKNDLPE